MADEPLIIKVPTTLQDKVTIDSRGVDLETLERAEAVIANLQGDYLTWIVEDLAKFSELVTKIKSLPVDERGDTAKEIFEVAHDVKGQGGSFGFPLITTVANLLCRFIEANELFSDAAIEVIGLHVDAMRLVIGENIQGPGGTKGEKLVSGLVAISDKVGK